MNAENGERIMKEDHRRKHRYGYLDALRGITLISMMLYHTVWDLVYLAGADWEWFRTDAAFLWQQSICWSFILLSGFCWSLGKRRLYHGLTVLGAGILISAVTWIFAYNERITFGILTFLGTAMLLLIPLEKILRRIPAAAGGAASFLCFLFTKGINDGYLGFESRIFGRIELSRSLYQKGYLFSFFGFPDESFYSADYFSVFPWIFLFVTGYFLYRICERKNLLARMALHIPRLPFEILGRHSLIIYLLHQPVIYGTLILMGLL